MSTQLKNDPAAYTTQVIKQVINAWAAQSTSVTNFYNKYPDDAYEGQVSPGRNSAHYLLGHLISASDGMLPMFGLGERLFPQYEEWFSKNPDGTFSDIPSVTELKASWELVNKTLTAHFNATTTEAWLSRHTRVSEEDFEKDPLRNKLNVLIGRTTHISYHLGQLVFLKQSQPAL